MVSPDNICFAAEATLGKLTKWLRLLGFDTLYPVGGTAERITTRSEINRILLTRTRKIEEIEPARKKVFIRSNDPFEQIKEVVQNIGIVPADIRPFSRCTRCNVLIEKVRKDAVRGRVPDYVWESTAAFRICRQCRRIYWPGSHTRKSRDIIKQFFET